MLITGLLYPGKLNVDYISQKIWQRGGSLYNLKPGNFRGKKEGQCEIVRMCVGWQCGIRTPSWLGCIGQPEKGTALLRGRRVDPADSWIVVSASLLPQRDWENPSFALLSLQTGWEGSITQTITSYKWFCCFQLFQFSTSCIRVCHTEKQTS